MVSWKETAFPLWKAMERRWKRNVVSRVSSVIVVIRLPIIIIIIIIDPGTQFPGNEKIRQLFLLLLLLLQYTNMLDLLTVRPKFSRPACHMQPAMRTASRCTALLLPRVLWDRQTDGQMDTASV